MKKEKAKKRNLTQTRKKKQVKKMRPTKKKRNMRRKRRKRMKAILRLMMEMKMKLYRKRRVCGWLENQTAQSHAPSKACLKTATRSFFVVGCFAGVHVHANGYS